MRARFVFATSTLLAAFACSSFGAEGGSGNRDPSETDDDAGATSDVRSPAESDGGVTTDGSPAVDAGLLPGNAFASIDFKGASSLDDFERGNAPAGGPFDWSEGLVGDDSGFDAIEVTKTCPGSSACSNRVLVFRNAPGRYGFLTMPVRTKTRIYRLDFGMKLESLNNAFNGQVQLASLALEENRFVFLELRGNRLRVGDQYFDGSDYRTDFTDLTEVTLGNWSAYQLYVNLDLGLIAVTMNGALQPVRAIRPESIATPQAIRVGISYAAYDAFTVSVDNVGIAQWNP